MPQQLNKDHTPDDILELAQQYQELLSKSNVPIKLEQTIADMERRVAEMNSMSVEDWKRHHEAMTEPDGRQLSAPHRLVRAVLGESEERACLRHRQTRDRLGHSL